MEDNKLTNVNEEVEEEIEEIEETPERSIGTGWAMLLGSGLTLAAIAAGKKAKKLWQNRKAKKERDVEEPEVIIEVQPEVIEEADQTDPQTETSKKKGKK